MQDDCTKIKITAERRIGKFSKELPKTQGEKRIIGTTTVKNIRGNYEKTIII